MFAHGRAAGLAAGPEQLMIHDHFVETYGSAPEDLAAEIYYVRVDAAVYFRASDRLRLQLNVENLLDTRYFVSAHTNDNVSPGAPRAAYLGLTYDF